jgi:hypothetical protein
MATHQHLQTGRTLYIAGYGRANVKMPPPDGIVTICLPFTAYVIAELDMSPPRLTRQSSSQLDAARFMSHER